MKGCLWAALGLVGVAVLVVVIAGGACMVVAALALSRVDDPLAAVTKD